MSLLVLVMVMHNLILELPDHSLTPNPCYTHMTLPNTCQPYMNLFLLACLHEPAAFPFTCGCTNDSA